MAGMQFEYDEQGGTFYYFLLSFIALVLIPATYYLWPRKRSKDDLRLKKQCHCEPCKRKECMIKDNQPWVGVKRKVTKIILIIGWIIFAYVAYKTSQVELDFTEFDPYSELGIDRGAGTADIKKAYRRLSMIYHPDRGGDSHKFMRITKAYDALTDEEARKNWEEYGNPDGPGATHFGIALPKWIVEKQNSIWVLGVYALIFMIILPVCVGTWWYRSIRYSAQQVLINTTKLYYHFLRRSPNMILKRAIMVLAASQEFNKQYNSEIVERPSDEVELRELMRDLPGLNQNVRENPFCWPYCAKARVLLTAHFTRKEFPAKTLELDKQYLLKKCPYLLNEMITILFHLFTLDQMERVPFKLNLATLDNIMKLSQMVVQGLWCHKSPLLQLPHVTEDMLRHFVNKRRNIRSLKQFASMNETDRRFVLQTLNESQYRDVMNVCAALPDIELKVDCEVKGEDDKTITAGSLVTVTVQLIRHSLVGDSTFVDADQLKEVENVEEEEELEEDEQSEHNYQGDEKPTAANKQQKWVNKKKKGGAKKPKKKTAPVKTVVLKKPVVSADKKEMASEDTASNIEPAEVDVVVPAATALVKNKPKVEEDRSADESSSTDDESVEKNVDGKPEEINRDDDDEWTEFQMESKKDNILETKSKETHLVHCPFFPSDKYEWWWLYLSDAKKKQLVGGPIQICTLTDHDEKEFRFAAPPKPGSYQYVVNVRSDSYLGLDQTLTFKIDVKEAKKIEDTHPQWDFKDDEEDEDKKDDMESESNVSSDDELSDDD